MDQDPIALGAVQMQNKKIDPTPETWQTNHKKNNI